MSALAKVTSKGQITLPKEVRELLHVKTGSLMLFEKEGGMLIIKTAKTLQDFRGVLNGRQTRTDFEEMRKKAKEQIGKKTLKVDKTKRIIIDTKRRMHKNDEDRAYREDC